MKQQTKGPFLVLWIVVTTFFIGFVLPLKADTDGASVASDWVQTKGPYGGHVYTLYATPEGTLFAGMSSAGIFRSTDLGDSWTPVNAGLPYEPGEGFYGAVYAQKGNTLYAGSGGLYASTDSGDTWHHIPTLQTRLVINGVVVIGERIYISTYEDGIWYSDDDGDSWIPVNDGLGRPTIRVLSNTGTTLVVGTENGAFRKKAGEEVWTPINAGFVEKPMDMGPINRARVASGSDPLPRQHFPSGLRVDAFTAMENLLYIGILTGGDDGLFRSDDKGNSWTRITTKEMTHTVEALATSGTVLYAGTTGGGVFRSEDKGDTWITVNNGLTDQTVSALLAVSEDIVFVGTWDGGIFRTTDGGKSWVEANTGLMGTSVKELEVVGQTIYAGTSHRLFYSIDKGASWQFVKMPSPTEYTFTALSVSGGKLYVAATRYTAGSQGGTLAVAGVFQLEEDNNVLVELMTHDELSWIECMEIVGPIFYVGTQGNGIFRWEQGSDSWTNLGLEGHHITALSVNGKHIHAGTWNGEIFRSKNAGKRWEPTSSDTLDSLISDLRWVGSRLYAATWGKGAFRSTNDGDSWTPLHYGLGNSSSVTTMEPDGAAYYIGTYYKGVFQWIEDKKWWKPMGSLRHRVDSLAVLDGFLYAGTNRGGVYRIPIEK